MASWGLSFIAVPKTGSIKIKEERKTISLRSRLVALRPLSGPEDGEAIAPNLLTTILFTFRNIGEY
jgi:hypothetical protein